MRGRGIAAAGITLGLFAVAGLATISVIAEGPEPLPLRVTTASLLVLLAAPFLVSLLAFWIASPALRGGVWVGAGIVSIVVPAVIVSFASLLLLPGAVGLIIAGASAHGGINTSRFVAATAAVFAAGSLALASWLLLRDGHCWYRTADGWDERPYSTVQRATFETGDPATVAHSVCGSAPTVVGLGLGMGAWVLAGAATVVVGRRTSAPDPVPA